MALILKNSIRPGKGLKEKKEVIQAINKVGSYASYPDVGLRTEGSCIIPTQNTQKLWMGFEVERATSQLLFNRTLQFFDLNYWMKIGSDGSIQTNRDAERGKHFSEWDELIFDKNGQILKEAKELAIKGCQCIHCRTMDGITPKEEFVKQIMEVARNHDEGSKPRSSVYPLEVASKVFNFFDLMENASNLREQLIHPFKMGNYYSLVAKGQRNCGIHVHISKGNWTIRSLYRGMYMFSDVFTNGNGTFVWKLIGNKGNNFEDYSYPLRLTEPLMKTTKERVKVSELKSLTEAEWQKLIYMLFEVTFVDKYKYRNASAFNEVRDRDKKPWTLCEIKNASLAPRPVPTKCQTFNVSHSKTTEMRFFGSTTNPEEIISNLEIAYLAWKFLSIPRVVTQATPKNFLNWLEMEVTRKKNKKISEFTFDRLADINRTYVEENRVQKIIDSGKYVSTARGVGSW